MKYTLAACALTVAGTLHAQTTFNFNLGATAMNGTAAGSDSVFSYAGDTWTELGNWANAIDVSDSEGGASTVDVSFTAGTPTGQWANGDATAGILGSYGYKGSNTIEAPTITLTIDGLIDGAAYNLALYGLGDNVTQGTTFTIGGVAKTTDASASTLDAALTDGVNYVTYDTVVATSGTITVEIDNRAGQNYLALNGFQVQAVPEPSAFGLLAGLAALGFVAARRRS